MKILFNELPKVSYSPDFKEHSNTIDQGYAAHIENKNNATVLFFQDVEDHVDNNGPAILWLIQGKGQFFVDGEPIEMKAGDAILFDDYQEHGFGSQELCVAVNFSVTPEQTLDDMKQMVRDFNNPRKKLKM
jgi:quercetin dioxygenase-like cupin family protein